MENALTILQSLQLADFDAGAVFSGTPSGKTVKGYAAPSHSPRLLTSTISTTNKVETSWSGS